MSNRHRRIEILVAIAALLAALAAPSAAEPRAVKVVGRATTVVTTPSVRLGDIAEVSSSRSGDEEVVIGLKRLMLASSPAPGRELRLDASMILDRLSQAGVKIDEIGYTFPKTLQVTRASRALAESEVRNAIEAYISRSGKDIILKDLLFGESVQVPPGDIAIEAYGFSPSKGGEAIFALRVSSAAERDIRVRVRARVEEWSEVPVATRPIVKGSVIDSTDVVMARINAAAIPNDAARDGSTIVGLATNNDIGSGEVFRQRALAMPIVIPAGMKVTLMYSSKLLRVTATGIAVEAGIAGQQIKVRNESSKKIVVGTVVERGLVKVSP